MSSPEELTFVVGRWLWPFVVILYVGRRLGFWPISSREPILNQVATSSALPRRSSEFEQG